MEAPPPPLSSRPERTRISCHAALDKAAYAPFRKEGRMKCTNATKSDRKSQGSEVEGSAVQRTSLGNVSRLTQSDAARVVSRQPDVIDNFLELGMMA